jgi:hypothetical protein
MAKLIFVYDPNGAPKENMRMIMPQGMEFEFFDPAATYPMDTVFYYDMYGPGHDHITRHLQQGCCVIFDAKNEHYINYTMHYVLLAFLQHPGQGCFIISGHEPNPLPGVKIIATPYWYWIMDQKKMTSTGIDQIVWQSRSNKKKFFMSLGKSRIERDYVFDSLTSHLSDGIYSYQARDIALPNDHTDPVLLQRYINPDWMHSTALTLAVETYVDETRTTGYSLTRKDSWFLCEKSYKPLAAQHPFLMISTPGNLAYLRSQGFETFPELFDESYDNVIDWKHRVQNVIAVLANFEPHSVEQPVVLQKLKHNQARFFDKSITADLAFRTIQQPLFEFVND